MASLALKPATIASTSNRRNIGTLIPPFIFVKNSRRRNDLQAFRKHLRNAVQQGQWGTVAMYCSRSIFEVALEDLLVARRPNYCPPGNLDRLIRDFLTGDFGMVITAHTADQARLIQALGNLAVHGSGGQFIWTEQRALRFLDLTAVLVHLAWLHHPDVPHQAQEASVQLPDYSAKKTAKVIALEISRNTKALAAYPELLGPQRSQKGAHRN